MRGDWIPVTVCATRLIPRATEGLSARLGLKPGWRSLAILTASCDDALYCALDQATKEAQVEVVYAKSSYAGADNAPSKTAGEVIGILAAQTPAQAAAGLEAAEGYLGGQAGFRWADQGETTNYFAHTISSSGRYLSAQAGIEAGEPLAYLVAPPMESVFGLDEALKAAEVRLVSWFNPPTETNYGGGLLTGSQAACEAACIAFAQAVEQVAQQPREV
jgi:ethanolamine utilization protein EutL